MLRTNAQTVTSPFLLFHVELARVRPLSPSLSRFTFTGRDLQRFADTGFDQRIKLILPLPGIGLEAVPLSDDWYAEWRALPPERQNPLRTYTVRAVRTVAREIDVDIVLHGDAGPASAWAGAARPGDPLIILGPNRDFDGVRGGIDFVPPAQTGTLLLVGDETALPAIASILERLPVDARGLALVEVPDARDRAALGSHPGVEVRVVARGSGEPGSALLPAVRAATALLVGTSWLDDADADADADAARRAGAGDGVGDAALRAGAGAVAGATAGQRAVDLPGAAGPGNSASLELELKLEGADREEVAREEVAREEAALEDVDVDTTLLWEVPVTDGGLALCDRTDLYAWVAAEAGVVKQVRRHLVGECGLDRASVAFMGYWRLGRSDLI